MEYENCTIQNSPDVERMQMVAELPPKQQPAHAAAKGGGGVNDGQRMEKIGRRYLL